jgi:methylglutamate dehydrogenase subunit A
MLDLPATTVVRGRDGNDHERPMWTYWCLQEGTLGVDPSFLTDNAGNMPPVIHVDTDAPLIDDLDGSLVTDALWGIYYKPDFHFGGVQGGDPARCSSRSAFPATRTAGCIRSRRARFPGADR